MSATLSRVSLIPSAWDLGLINSISCANINQPSSISLFRDHISGLCTLVKALPCWGFNMAQKLFSFLFTVATPNLSSCLQVLDFTHHSLCRSKYKNKNRHQAGGTPLIPICKLTWIFLNPYLHLSSFLHWSPSLCLLHAAGFLQDLIWLTASYIASGASIPFLPCSLYTLKTLSF